MPQREFPRLNPRDLIRTSLLNGHSEALEDLRQFEGPWASTFFGQPSTGHPPVYGFLAQLSAVDASSPKKYSWVRLVDVDSAGNWSYPSETIEGGPGSVSGRYPAYPYDPAAEPPVGSVVWLEPSANGECFHFFWQPFSGTIPGSPTFSGTPVFAGGFTVSAGTVTVSGTTSLSWTSTGTFTFTHGGMVFGQTTAPGTRPAGYLVLPWITGGQVPTYTASPGEVVCNGKELFQSDGSVWYTYYPFASPTPVANAVPYVTSGGTISQLPIGSAGDVLTVVAGAPAWQAPAGTSLTVGTTAIAGGTSGRLLYDNAGAVGELAQLTPDLLPLATAVALAGTPTLSAAPVWYKVPVSYADLSTAGTTNTVTLLNLPAKGYVHSVVVKHSTAFSGGALATYTLSVGLTGSLSKYVSGFSVTTAPSGTGFKRDGGTTPAPDLIDFGAATALKVTAASTGANLNAATAGAADVYLLLSALV